MDINAIFDRICKEKGFKTDSALADFLGVSKSAVNQSRTKNTANLWTVINACQGMDLNWVLRGESIGQPMTAESALCFLVAKGFKVTLG